MEFDREKAKEHVGSALRWLGFDIDGEAMRDTPRRVVDAWIEMTAEMHGGDAKVKKLLAVTFDGAKYDQAVALANIDFVSLCEHHLLPFSGRAGVAYIPHERVVGLSKLARVVDLFARRAQLQERMTQQIADAVNDHLRPVGVMVVVEATHSCMSCRGPRKSGAIMRTSALRGLLHKDGDARAEVMKLLNGG